MGFLQGKRLLITGVTNERSIAWGVAKAMHREGAQLAFSYPDEKLRPRLKRLAEQLDSALVLPCNVSDDEQIAQLFLHLQSHWTTFDGLLHSIAWAPADHLQGDYIDTVTRDGFNAAHEISSYSFVALAKAARSMINPGGAMLTMSYLGAERALPHYNVMGLAKASLEANVRYMAASLGPQQIRVNAVSAGPIRTAAAKGIADFDQFYQYGQRNAPLRRNVTIDEVGNTAAFLCSDLASGITGEVLYVDAGYHIQGMALSESTA